MVIHEAASPLEYMPKPGARVPGLTYIGRNHRDACYRVTAPPSRFTIYALTGFNAPEGRASGRRPLAP